MGIVKHIPNTITSMNLLCGAVGVIFSFQDRLDIAFYLMLGAAACDFMDGFAARLLHAYSPLGKELDSLADAISFGLLPSLMLHCLILEETGNTLISCIPLLIAVFSALRLAKFNIDDEQTENFLGLPTPASAMIAGSFVHYVSCTPDSIMHAWAGSSVFVIVGTLVLTLLMTSRIPMFSMKFKKGTKAASPVQKMRIALVGIFCCCTGLIILLGLTWSMIVLLTFVFYILINVINLISTARRKAK